MEGFSHISLRLVSTIQVKGAYCAFFPLFCHISRLRNYTVSVDAHIKHGTFL